LPPDEWLWDEFLVVISLGKTPWRNPFLAGYWTMGAVRHGEYVAKLRITPQPSAAEQVRIRDLDPLTNPEACGTRSWRISASTITPSNSKRSCA
jgi:hypothetical protein